MGGWPDLALSQARSLDFHAAALDQVSLLGAPRGFGMHTRSKGVLLEPLLRGKVHSLPEDSFFSSAAT